MTSNKQNGHTEISENKDNVISMHQNNVKEEKTQLDSRDCKPLERKYDCQVSEPSKSQQREAGAVVGSISSNSASVTCKMSIADKKNNKTVHFLYERTRPAEDVQHKQNPNTKEHKVSTIVIEDTSEVAKQRVSMRSNQATHLTKPITNHGNSPNLQANLLFVNAPKGNAPYQPSFPIQKPLLGMNLNPNDLQERRTAMHLRETMRYPRVPTKASVTPCSDALDNRLVQKAQQNIVREQSVFDDKINDVNSWHIVSNNAIYETITPPPPIIQAVDDTQPARVPVIRYPVGANKPSSNSRHFSEIDPALVPDTRLNIYTAIQPQLEPASRVDLREANQYYLNTALASKLDSNRAAQYHPSAHAVNQSQTLEIGEQLFNYKKELLWLEAQANRRNEEKNELLALYKNKLNTVKELEREISINRCVEAPLTNQCSKPSVGPAHLYQSTNMQKYVISTPRLTHINCPRHAPTYPTRSPEKSVRDGRKREFDLTCSQYQNLYSRNLCGEKQLPRALAKGYYQGLYHQANQALAASKISHNVHPNNSNYALLHNNHPSSNFFTQEQLITQSPAHRVSSGKQKLKRFRSQVL